MTSHRPRSINSVKRILAARYKQLKNYRKVAAEFGLSPAMVCIIITQDYEPKRADIRLKLGLSAFAYAPVCYTCGIVHVSKRCPERRTLKRWRDLPPELLKIALETRA
jgi:hypothetical protein